MSGNWPGRFHGGLAIVGHKTLSSETPIQPAGLPPLLCFPLRQRGGDIAPVFIESGERVLRGRRIAGGEHPMDPPIHASTSGRVLAIAKRPIPHPEGLIAPCLLIEPDGLDEASAPLPPLAIDACSPEDVLARIHAAGIVGLGGAGFPTTAKLASGQSPIETLILNGAECEPYLTCDDRLLRERADEVLRGADILARLLGATKTLIAIESDMPLAFAATERARVRGGFAAMAVVQAPARYPAGSERQLIQLLTARETPAGGLPADIGIVCLNVATAAAIHRAVDHGWVMDSRIVTVTGHGVRNPRNLEVRLGTPIGWLIEQCGGYAEDAERLILGGPMMGFAVATDVLPVTKTVNAVLVARAGELGTATTPLPCIRCGTCAGVCPARLLPQQLYWHAQAQQWQKTLDQHLFDCIECGCCDVVCPSQIPLVRLFRTAKQSLIGLQQEREKAEQAQRRFEARQARLAAEQRDRERAALARKTELGKAASPKIQEALARARLKRAGQAGAMPNHPHGEPLPHDPE